MRMYACTTTSPPSGPPAPPLAVAGGACSREDHSGSGHATVSAVTGAGPGAHRLLRDVGEDGLVRAVLERYTPAPAFMVVGPGDDAAVLDTAGRVVVST